MLIVFQSHLQGLYQFVSRLPRWVDFSFPKEYLFYVNDPPKGQNPEKQFYPPKRAISDSDDDDDMHFASPAPNNLKKSYGSFIEDIDLAVLPFLQNGVLESLDISSNNPIIGLFIVSHKFYFQ
jgi:hypothetical protein